LYGVDQEVHATAGREAGATGSLPIGTVHSIGNRLYTNRQNALRFQRVPFSLLEPVQEEDAR
jgi:hypothetical protein